MKVISEGRLLYKSEKASWTATDMFLEKFAEEKENIGGYFSYADGDYEKCVFYSVGKNPKVVEMITFDSTYNKKSAKVDLKERDFTSSEKDLYLLRELTNSIMTRDTSFFMPYPKSTLNLIPIINGKDKKVYALTGPEEDGIVIFGNDYLLTFDKRNNLSSKKKLHNSVIPIKYSLHAKLENKEGYITSHTHMNDEHDLITATDICTLMLYENKANWKSHIVIGKKHCTIWNCQKNVLSIIKKEELDQMYKDADTKH